MSVRAYRIIKWDMKTEDKPSFNIWSDTGLKDFLDAEIDFNDNLNSDGTGIVEVPIKLLKSAIKKSSELNISEETVERIREDIKFARSNSEDFVTYFCC